MTKFDKDAFIVSSEQVSYINREQKTIRPVARFKYQRKARTSFINFLVKNFTVEEYFSKIDSGMAPYSILESKGYLFPHIKKMLKELGMPPTVQAFNALLANREAMNELFSRKTS